jgi:MarR-like DNA-binding transcriptional regulator SgrR of sgrS sRNA
MHALIRNKNGQAGKPVLRMALAIALVAQALLPAATSLRASTRPRYGGTLRVMMQQRVDSLDPREIPSDSQRGAATERLLSLVSERLVRLDEKGQPQPELAISWTHSPNFKRWEFKLRPNVKFHDGTLLTPGIVAGRLQLLGDDAVAAVVGDAVRIESTNALPNLLYELALWRNAIFKMAGGNQTASLVGTGAFKFGEFFPGRNATFIASEDHWAGRPFVDQIEVEMGVNPREQAIAQELGKADVVELGPTEFRRATQAGRRAWASQPVGGFALVFRPDSLAAADSNIRAALALSIDRASIHSVLLQRQGEPSAALLPQWLSGYAFVFVGERNLKEARKLLASVRQPPRAIVLDYEAGDLLSQSVAERVVVNAREAGLPMQLAEQINSRVARADVRLLRYRASTANALHSLGESLKSMEMEPSPSKLPSPTSAIEQIFDQESSLLSEHRVIPIAHLPVMFGLSTRVKNWMPTRMGEWRLADVWIEQETERRTGEEKDRGQAGVPVPREKH